MVQLLKQDKATKKQLHILFIKGIFS